MACRNDGKTIYLQVYNHQRHDPNLNAGYESSQGVKTLALTGRVASMHSIDADLNSFYKDHIVPRFRIELNMLKRPLSPQFENQSVKKIKQDEG